MKFFLMLLASLLLFQPPFVKGYFVDNPLRLCEAGMPGPGNYAPPPNSATLLQVHVFTRHGDRSPLQASQVPGVEEQVEWNCQSPLQPAEALLGNTNLPAMSMITKVIPANQAPVGIPKKLMWRGDCDVGQLTPKGADQHRRLGAALRQIYVDTLHFLPPTLDNSAIVARSTNVPRTKESAMNFLSQLYPAESRITSTYAGFPQPQQPIIPLYIYKDEYENLHHAALNCPQISDLDKKVANSQTITTKQNELQGIIQKMKALYGDSSSLHSFFINLGCRKCNNKVMPNLQQQVTISDQELFALQDFVTFTTDYSMLGEPAAIKSNQLKSRSLMEELMNKLTQPRQERFFLYSGHDDTIALLLGAFAAAPEEMSWPPYVSNFIVELWQDSNGPFIRVIYNGHLLKVRGWCDMSYCPLQNVLSHFQPTLSLNMNQECISLNNKPSKATTKDDS